MKMDMGKWFNDCMRKKRYATIGSAALAAAHRSKATGHDLRPYECQWCAQYHIGHYRRKKA